MARYTKKLETFLFKIQADETVAETEFAGSDYQDISDGSITTNIDSTEVDSIGPEFDQPAAVPGRQTADLMMKYPLRGFGLDGVPAFSDALQCCGFTESQYLGYYIYIPNSLNNQAGSGRVHYGKMVADGFYDYISMFKGNFKISIESGKIGTLEITGKAAYHLADSGEIPTITRNRTAVPAVLSATVSINALDFKMISFEVDGNQAADVDIDPTTVHGCGQSTMTDRKIKWSAKVYSDEQLNPDNAIASGAIAATTIYWGLTNDVKIDIGYSQITDCKRSDQNGITTWDISGQCNRNDFLLSVKAGVSSSSSDSPSSSVSSSPSASVSSSPSSSASSSTS
jgi:hypothetical protein